MEDYIMSETIFIFKLRGRSIKEEGRRRREQRKARMKRKKMD
jgi:hypothetical protein